jgi:excisionase family DNA binding protein
MPTPHDTPHAAQLTGTTTEPDWEATADPPTQPPTEGQTEGPFRPLPPDTGSRPRELLRVEEAAERLAIGRTRMFALIREHAVESVKVGRLRRVPADALTAYIRHLVAEQQPTTA